MLGTYVDVPTWWAVLAAVSIVIGVILFFAALIEDEVIPGIIGVVLVFVSMIYGFGYIGNKIDQKGCREITRTLEIDTQYPSLWTGCYVKVNGKWIPSDRWRGVDDD